MGKALKREMCVCKLTVLLFTVDEEFESVATQVLKRTQAMVNKYRRLLMVEAEVRTHTLTHTHPHTNTRALLLTEGPTCPVQRSSPSSEMVMIDRTFNQEERSNLTQDKRMVLVDPGTDCCSFG